jgi:hypothetical protein
MRKMIIFATSFGLTFGPVAAFAQSFSSCGASAHVFTTNTLGAFLTGVMVCNPSTGTVGNFASQEFHTGTATGGTFTEFSDPARNPYGSYAINISAADDTITYTYGSTTTPQYIVGQNIVGQTPSTLYFCLATTDALVYTTKIHSGNTACS